MAGAIYKKLHWYSGSEKALYSVRYCRKLNIAE
jgi:hypothetical protein